MSYIQFGSGAVYINPVSGNLAAAPSPVQLQTIGDLSLDISADIKELFGQSQYPDDVAAGQKKITGKLVLGRVDVDLFNQIFFADSEVATGAEVVQQNEAGTVPATSTFTVTVANAATFTQDLGVVYATNTSKRLTRVSSAPSTGQYTVSAGVYTFSSGDASAAVKLSYVYTPTTADGISVTVNNQSLGYGPVFELFFVHSYQLASNQPSGIHLYAARATKLSAAMKQTDYTKPEVDFSCFANSAGKVLHWLSING